MILDNQSNPVYWKPAKFDFYAPYSPFRIDDLKMSGTVIDSVQAIHEASGVKIDMSSITNQNQRPPRVIDPDGYPSELEFSLENKEQIIHNEKIKIIWQGYCQFSPLGLRLFTVYQESNVGTGEVT